MTLNATTIVLRDGRIGNGFGQPTSFSESTDFQDGATINGNVYQQGDDFIIGNVVLTRDPLNPLAEGKIEAQGSIRTQSTLDVLGQATFFTGVRIVGSLQGFDAKFTSNLTAATINATSVKATTFSGTINTQPWKSFDIRHPNKEGWRLRHVCVEGPEAAIYIRGKLETDNKIKLPDYWKGLVDYDSITVDLTPFGKPDPTLYVENINEDEITIASDGEIKTFYTVTVARLGDMLVEYEGESVDDYPGDPTNFTYQE